jgi:Phosphotransferase enzyme family
VTGPVFTPSATDTTGRGATPVWRPEHLSTAWLTRVLREAGVLGRGRVVDFGAEPLGTGQMADSVRVTLSYAAAPPDAPASVVAKFTAADDTSRATALALRTSEVEVRFYQQVAATVRARTARCYFADVATSTAAFVLVLEDFADARVGDQLAGCGPDEAALALAELAALHAPRWGDPALGGLEWLTRHERDPAAGAELLPALFAGFVDRYGGVLESSVVAVGEHLMAHIGSYLRRRPGPRTVQHADFRLDNLLFGADAGRRVGVVDWQTVRLGEGAADVSYFLGAGLDPGDRRAHEHALLHEYHDRLLAAGVVDYTFDRLVTDYRRHAYAGYIMAMGASMLVERTARGDEMFLAMARRHAAQIEDLGSEALLAED